jgi:hypothetical protein
MGHRNTLNLRAHDEPFWVVVEPWASEFLVPIGEECLLLTGAQRS